MISSAQKIYHRIRNRMRFMMMEHIPMRPQLKPKGVKKLRELSRAGVDVLELRPPYTSRLILDEKFIEDCSPYIKPVLKVEYPADYVAVIKSGRIFSYDSCDRAVISSDNYLIEEPSLQWRDSPAEGKYNKVFSVKGFSKPKKYGATVFSLLSIGAAKYYYYHWMFDAMPKLAMLKMSGLFDEIDYFLIPTYKFPYAKQYLEHFGIDQSRIIDEDFEKHIEADKLVVCSDVRLWDHQPKWACDFLYDSFKSHFSGTPRTKLLYIARGDAARSRKVLNEAAVVALLQSYGFEIYLLSHVSVLEQAQLFNSARLIVAVHGGGLANLVYCEPGTTLLEIYPDQYVRHYFYDLAQKKDLIYDYLLCESERPVTTLHEGEEVNLTVDIDAMKKKLDALLANG